MFDTVWCLLEAAVVDPASALRWPVVATVSADGPSARLMVLRSADRVAGTLAFYTDQRAAKVAELTDDPRIAITGYDPASRLQLRLYGTATLLTGSPVSKRWHAIGDSERQAYATTLPPGSRLDAPGSGLPVEAALWDCKANFAVLEVSVIQLEWLLLAASGHRRARHEYRDNRWSGSWLVP